MTQDVPVVVSPVAHPPQNGPIADRHYQELLDKGLDPGRAAAALVMHMAEWPRDTETWEPVQPQKFG